MKIELNGYEARVIGCLLEKEITTPDQYPLSLNALRNAVNQKSNREPVLALTESEVQNLVDALIRKHLVSDRSGFSGGRVVKYKHRFCNTEFGAFQLDPQELAIVCLLFLRGPQTPGELRTRSARLCDFADVSEVEAALQRMAAREDGAIVAKLPREPGRRESRYCHLFGDEDLDVAASVSAEADYPQGDDRIAALEQEVARLRSDLEQIREALGLAPDNGAQRAGD